jgi:hypothetical protein
MKKLTKADILAIQPGKGKIFSLETKKAVMSARSYVWQIGKVEPANGVSSYKTVADLNNNTIYVEAVAERAVL